LYHVTNLFSVWLSGYNTKINTDAKQWLDYMRTECDYGNDYVTQGTKFVAALQDVLIGEAQARANDQSLAALDAARVSEEQMKERMFSKQSILIVQMSVLALQLYSTVQLVCQSYAYQATALYQECVVQGSVANDNKMRELCGDFADGNFSFPMFA